MNDAEIEAAREVFKSFGHDPTDLSAAGLKSAWRAIARVCHPDHGGSTARMGEVNVAYQVLLERLASEPPQPREVKQHNPAGPHHDEPVGPYTPPSSRTEPEAKPAAGAGHVAEGRFSAPDAQIRRRDYSDRNFIRQIFAEKASPEEREPFHVQAFDGSDYVGLTIHGAAQDVPEMVKAVSRLHRADKGADPLAVLVRPQDLRTARPPSLWLTGRRQATIELQPDARSVNDPAFVEKLNRIINSASRTL
jgi:curved DNA-binding protein CbpA